MRAADPVKADTVSVFPSRTAQFTHGIRALSRPEVEDLIGGLIDLLDAMDGDADREPEVLDASAVEWTGRGAHRFNVGEAA
ncbi:hypothetical protein MKK75_17985 [Methylobacterium sp. J-030]|uniref:hypothetical protein n=1 Tax=Methylobacterium sp. J-030 TaxID=2836627 RepID=UPI001FB9EEEB|nr:hypothetical protein [Methylobacterium sp. J-030]MCJ2070658.1 hypothetical protein [Methylobacterium sp. J-030]